MKNQCILKQAIFVTKIHESTWTHQIWIAEKQIWTFLSLF